MIARVMVLGAVAGLAGGCVSGTLNDELTIGDQVELSALSATERVAVPSAGEVEERPAPSVRGISRENWKPMTFVVPVDGVAHYAEINIHPQFTNQNARQVGLYPTEQTVYETTNNKAVGQQALEAVAEAFYSALDIVMAIPRAILVPPWTVMQSPRDWYQRGPLGAPAMVAQPGGSSGNGGASPPPILEPARTPDADAVDPTAAYDAPAPGRKGGSGVPRP